MVPTLFARSVPYFLDGIERTDEKCMAWAKSRGTGSNLCMNRQYIFQLHIGVMHMQASLLAVDDAS